MPGGKCVFNNDWLENGQYKDWLLSVAESRHKARCSPCNKIIDVSNMGESSLKYHAKGSKHQKLVKNLAKKIDLKSFFSTQDRESTHVKSSSHSQPSTSNAVLPLPVANLDKSVNINNLSTKAEILWALKVLNSHYSYKSCENVNFLFKNMFSDSEIAKNFSCGEKKTAYLSVFGIAPYFSSLLKSRVKSETDYVLLFDESMNDVSQSKQLDCHVRFWDHNKVSTRYYASDFLGHATSELLVEKINEKCLEIGTKSLLQLSMDGPNVNLKVFDLIMEKMQKEHARSLLNIGTCGLHIIHNGFRGGCSASFPEVEQGASSAYWFFKDSPARREDFVSLNEGVKFPIKFCKHRWVENECVLVRLLEILPDIKIFLDEIEKKKFTRPTSKSFGILQEVVKDELFSAKCNFLLSICKDIDPFLKKYQTDSPMLPFLNGDLYNLLKDLLKRFIKEEHIPSSSIKLLNINLEDKTLYTETTKINIGFVARKELKNLKKNFSTEKKVMEFYINCRKFLLILTRKIMEKCPLNYSLVRNMCCFDPRSLIANKKANCNKLQNILLYLTNAGRVKEEDCDCILKEYNRFLEDFNCMDTVSKFMHCEGDCFDPSVDRVDIFYYEFLSAKKYQNLWSVVKTLLLLSHGQASVERGFSINKNLLVENLGNKTIVAKRVIDDHLRFVGGLEKVIISKELITSAAGARQKYIAYLDEQKLCKKKKACSEKRKLLTESVDELKKKKICLENDIKELNKTSDDYSEQAETNCDISLISKANALRRHAKEKMNELKICDEKLNDMYLSLKSV